MLGGLGVVFLLVGGVAAWAARTEIAGAVLAAGTVVVESNVKKVQHPTGGVIGEIHVKDGDQVRVGDLLLRLDETVTRANLQMVTQQLDELAAREARLKAERDGADTVTPAAQLTDRGSDAEVQEILLGEKSLFESRRDTREGQKAQLGERITQLNEQIAGITGQFNAKSKEIALIGRELDGVEQLEAKHLVTTNRINQLRREAARLQGEHGQLRAEVAKTKGQIAEIGLQILGIDQGFKTELVKDLRETQSKEAELVERRIAAEDRLKRVEIRAPQFGIVHQLAVHTVGGVVNPGEPIMLIVPGGDRLVIEAKVAPSDIDQLHPQQSVLIRFPAFNQRTTPEIEGIVDRISADLTTEPQTHLSHFVVRIKMLDSALGKLGDKRLLPGMPAEVQIRTQDRTALSFLMKPLQDQIAKAWRER